MTKPPAFVFDIDGTLVEITPELRRHLEEDSFDLDTYHAATVHEAPASGRVLTLLRALQDANVAIIMSTYRERSYRDITLKLFDRLGIRPTKTYMRLPEDRDLPNALGPPNPHPRGPRLAGTMTADRTPNQPIHRSAARHCHSQLAIPSRGLHRGGHPRRQPTTLLVALVNPASKLAPAQSTHHPLYDVRAVADMASPHPRVEDCNSLS